MQQLEFFYRTLSTSPVKHLPIYLFFTHLDRIRGFNEFFAELTASERQQPFGFFTQENEEGNASEIANKHFTQLCIQLNERIVRHLHQQRHAYQRSLIHDFPLQFESLSNIVFPLVQHLFERTPTLNFAGIFFTSTIVLGVACDRLANLLTNHANLQSTPHLPQVSSQKTYFSHDLLTTLLPQHHLTQQQRPRDHLQKWQHKSAIGIICLIAVLSIGLMANEFNHDLNQLRTTAEAVKQSQLILAQHNTDSKHSLNDILFLMTSLSKSTNHLSFNLLPNAINPFKNWQQLQAMSQTNYQILLNHYFMPQLTHTLTTQMKFGGSSNEQLYNALKVYLMLSDPEFRQSEFISDWFKHYLNANSNFSYDQQTELAKHFKSILQKPSLIIDKDPQLVNETRAKLAAQPTSFLAYSLLKASLLSYTPTNIPEHNSVFVPNRYHFAIPTLFTQNGFSKTYREDIPAIVKSFIEGDWVLDTKANSSSSSSQQAELVQQIQMLYISDYVNWWNLFIYNSNILAFRNAEQAQQTFSELEKSHSLFSQLLHIIKSNTQAIPQKNEINAIFNSQIAKYFHDLNSMPEETSDAFQTIIKQLNQQIYTLSKNNSDEQTVFDIVKQRYNQETPKDALTQLMELSKKSPKPLNSWLQQLANNYWHMLLFKAQRYIDQQWQIAVYSDYQTNIANRYPFVKQAKDEIDLEHFTQFFSYQGKLDNFFKNYLQPFIDTSHAQWKVKSLHGSALPLNEKFIQQLIRAKLIRKMFFNEDGKTIDVKFSLKPISFEPIIKDFVLSINGQSVFTYQGSDKVSAFIWPGSLKDRAVKLAIDTINNKHFTLEEPGSWAWFKFLEKANVQPGEDTQHFQLLIALNGSAAKFALESDRPINPFIPNVLQQFELPIKLISE